MGADTDYGGLGFSFLMMGIGLTISLGLALDPVFLATGLPFTVLGLLFLAKGKDGRDEAEEA